MKNINGKKTKQNPTAHRGGHLGVDKVEDDESHGRMARKEPPYAVLPPTNTSKVT